MRRSAVEALQDMLVAAQDAATITQRGRPAFDTDRILQRAAKNLVAEIGEAAKSVPDDIARHIPGVPWRAVKGMREKVVHDYPGVDVDVLWTTLVQDIPALAHQVEAYLSRPAPDTT